MCEVFKKWFDENQMFFKCNEIVTEYIRRSPVDSPNPSLAVEQSTSYCLGQISVWNSGGMDIEVISIESEKTLLFEHHELQGYPDFPSILHHYVVVMKQGEVGVGG